MVAPAASGTILMLIQQTLLYLPAQFFGPLFQFVSMIVWTHWLVPEEMGVYALTTVSQEITYLLSLSWFSQYGLRYFPGKGQVGARNDYLRAETTILLVAGLLHMLAALLLAATFVDVHSPLALWGAMFAYFISRTWSVHLGERARADGHIGAYTIVQTAGPVAGLVCGIGLLTLAPDGVVSVLLGYAIPQFIGAFVVMGLIGYSLKPRWPDRALLEPALRYGLPLIGTAALAWCADHAVRYIVEYRLGSASLGLLSVGWGLGLRTSAFAAMLVSAAAFPLASKLLIEGRRDDALTQLHTNAAMLIALLVPALVGLWCVAPQLIELVIAEEYRAMTALILPIALLVGGARQLRLHITDQLFILDHNFHYSAVVNLIDITLSVLMIFIGVSAGGILGAAQGAMIGAVVATLASLAIAVIRSGFRYPFFGAVRVVVASGVMAVVLRHAGFSSGYGGLLLAIAGGTIVYALMIALLFPAERERVFRYLGKRLAPARDPSHSGHQ